MIPAVIYIACCQVALPKPYVQEKCLMTHWLLEAKAIKCRGKKIYSWDGLHFERVRTEKARRAEGGK